MKTSLICLLLAAVACAAPWAGEMPGEKHAGMTEKLSERAEKRKEIVEKLREMAKEKREAPESAAVVLKSDGEAESRNSPCRGTCFDNDKELLACHPDFCNFEYEIYEEVNFNCVCCRKYKPIDSCKNR